MSTRSLFRVFLLPLIRIYLLMAVIVANAQTPPSAGPDTVTHPHSGMMSAGPDGPHGQGGMSRWMNERMSMVHQRQLDVLKKELHLKPEQESAWTSYEKAMNAPLEGWGAAPKKDLYKLSTPERLDAMNQHMQQMQAFHKQRATATKALYGTLSPEQQKIFDTQTRRGPGLMHCDRD